MVNFVRKLEVSLLFVALIGCSGSGDKPGAKGPPPKGSGPTGLPTVPGTPDPSVTTTLPAVPRLPKVTATVTGDSVSISVEPVEFGKDYRVYPLPADADITSTADGSVTVRNAIYRCAGNRQAPSATLDGDDFGQSEAVKTLVDGVEVQGYRRTLAEATLGYVYVSPGDGRVPVYAVGNPQDGGDNGCYHQRWNESRDKRYVTADAERTQFLSMGWRDDGAVFYVSAPGAPGTKPVYSDTADDAMLFYVDGPEAERRGRGTVAFNVLAETAADTVPLMRVYYNNACGRDHDELTPGVPRFERARFQGDERPLWDLHWSGITGETVLVVEALDVGCPNQGVLGPIAIAGYGGNITYDPVLTLDQARAASATGEVFINGQHAAANRPRPIARSFVKVSPAPKPDMDWFAGFGPDETIPDFDAAGWNVPCEDPDNDTCWAQHRQSTDYADTTFMFTEETYFGLAPVLGELWMLYADLGGDVGGKFRMTPNTRAQMSDASYLHLTMEVDSSITARRYPQIWVSEATPPVQPKLRNSNSLLIQAFRDQGTANWPNMYQVQICDHRNWDVNDQCPATDFYRRESENGGSTTLMPIPEFAEHTGIDRSTHYDVFVSTRRAYLFLDRQPYGCVDLPTAGVPRGAVTITFGDVLYHSGADETFGFHDTHQKFYTKRHFDNLGFKSGVEGPAWDEARYPCFPASSIDN